MKIKLKVKNRLYDYEIIIRLFMRLYDYHNENEDEKEV